MNFTTVSRSELLDMGWCQRLQYLTLLSVIGEDSILKPAGLSFTIGTSLHDLVKYERITEEQWSKLAQQIDLRLNVRVEDGDGVGYTVAVGKDLEERVLGCTRDEAVFKVAVLTWLTTLHWTVPSDLI